MRVARRYDPVAAVKTDMEPRLRDNVELHDIFAHLEEQDTQVGRVLRHGTRACDYQEYCRRAV